MNKLIQHIINRAWLIRSVPRPLPLLLDSCRLKRGDYQARHKNGAVFSLSGGKGEWFTFFENVVREDYLRGISTQLKEGDCVVDIGANIGTFAVIAAQKVGVTGRVIAFEPDKMIFDRLQNNISINKLNNIVSINAAVGAEDGRMKFYKHSKNAYSSLMPTVDDRSDSHVSSCIVQVIGINKVIQQAGMINLLKIDCEGGEFDIFKAMSYDSAQKINNISMEIHKIDDQSPEELEHNIRSLGFDVHGGYPLIATRTQTSLLDAPTES